MQSVRLNLFQRLVRQWDQLHPYNAAQIMRLSGAPDIATLNRAWHETLSALGLGRVRVCGSRFGYENLNGDAQQYDVRVLPPGESLDAHVSAELNRPFDDAAEPPFRPFVRASGDDHFAGVIYHHWTADSASIRLLLREWFLRIYDPSRARQIPLRLPRGGYARYFSPASANWQLTEGILSSLRWTSRFKRVKRVKDERSAGFEVAFLLRGTSKGWIDRLHTRARARGITLNDLFLASIAIACNRYVPLRETAKRKDLALGTIVDLRQLVGEDMSEVFGLFLGFTSVVCRPSDLCKLDQLIDVISTQSRQQKETGVPLASPVRMVAGLAAGRFLPREKAVDFYRKRVPLAGGISNINLNHTWAARYHPAPLLEYIRVSPTGPMMPLVFTTTTLGDTFHFGLTYRRALFDSTVAGQLADDFLSTLDAWLNG